jgi:hypothetical protein
MLLLLLLLLLLLARQASVFRTGSLEQLRTRAL